VRSYENLYNNILTECYYPNDRPSAFHRKRMAEPFRCAAPVYEDFPEEGIVKRSDDHISLL